MAITPIFLISLPRSGSTFLQKILMSHSEIASTGEPWFLLPLCYMKRKKGVFTEYGHTQSVNALNRIETECGDGLVGRGIADYAISIYKQYCRNNERYFLDKTPRYYWIAEELIRIFPNAKFIVLLRNPLSVFASSIEGLKGNTVRRLDHLDADFQQGPARISAFIEQHRNSIHLVKYEELVKDPVCHIDNILSYLKLEYEEDMIENSFSIELHGHGDHLGARNYKKVRNNTDKWKQIINTSYRKMRLKSYLEHYPENYLREGEYSRAELLKNANEHKTKCFNLFEYFCYIEEIFVKLYKKPLRSLHD